MDRIAESLRAELPLEGQFIAACISMPATGESRTRALVLADRGPDWTKVASEAANHYLISPVYSLIARECADRVPPGIVAGLRARYAANAHFQQRLARELVEIHEALSSLGLGMLAIKGPALAVQAYGDLAARQAGDLDILVRQNDLPRIAKILSERGYRSRRYESGAVDFGFFRSFEDQFSRRGSPSIDVHLALLPRYFPLHPNHQAAWSRAVAIEIDGRSIQTLSPDDHLIFSIAHATKHGWGWASLRAMRDIAALTSAGVVDWKREERGLEQLGCGRMLRLGALLAHTFAGAQVPASVLDRAASDSKVTRLAREVARQLFPAAGLVPSVYCDWIVPLAAMEGWGKRMRYLIDRGLRPTIDDWEALPLPRPLYWLYYLTRPVRLFLLHSPRLV